MHHNSYYNVLKTDICEYAVNWSQRLILEKLTYDVLLTENCLAEVKQVHSHSLSHFLMLSPSWTAQKERCVTESHITAICQPNIARCG